VNALSALSVIDARVVKQLETGAFYGKLSY